MIRYFTLTSADEVSWVRSPAPATSWARLCSCPCCRGCPAGMCSPRLAPSRRPRLVPAHPRAVGTPPGRVLPPGRQARRRRRRAGVDGRTVPGRRARGRPPDLLRPGCRSATSCGNLRWGASAGHPPLGDRHNRAPGASRARPAFPASDWTSLYARVGLTWVDRSYGGRHSPAGSVEYRPDLGRCRPGDEGGVRRGVPGGYRPAAH